MRAALAVIVAILVWLVGTALSSLLVQSLAPIEQLESTAGQIGWSALPKAVILFAVVLFAGLAYGRSRPWSPLGAVAVAAPPIVEIVTVIVLSLLGDTPLAVIVAKALLGAAGALAAWWVVVPKGQTPALNRR